MKGIIFLLLSFLWAKWSLILVAQTMDAFKVHFPQIGTVRGKPVLPHHAEQIDFMSLHTTDWSL